MDKVKILDEPVNFKFDIYERIKLDRSEREIKEIFSTELKAYVSAILDGDYVEIIGSLVLNVEYFSIETVPSFSFTHSVPVEIRIPANRFTNVDCIEANIGNFDVEQVGAYVLNLTGKLEITEVEPEISPVKPLILTEEELNELAKKIAVQIGLNELFLLDKVIKSHSSLLSANAELSFKNMQLKKLCKKSFSFLDAMLNFSADNLQVQGWHLNGDTEPFENFISENVDSDLWQELKHALEELK